MNSSKSYSQGADRDEHYDRPQTRARPFRRFCAAVATSREVHRWPRLNLEVPYRRWEWALRRAHRELPWWSLRSLIRLSWFPGTAMYISGTNALGFWSLRAPRFASARKSRQVTHPGWKVRQRLRAFRGLYCQRAQPAVLDVLD